MADETGSKFCKRCGHWKPRTEFHAKRDSKDGLNSCCKPCAVEKTATWRRANPGRAADAARKRYQADPDRFRQRSREWRAANHDKALAAQRAWVDKNRERHLANIAAWIKAHPEEMAAHYRAKRARRAAAQIGGDVDLKALWTGACGICDEPLSADIRWPDPLSKSVDHIVPLARGGAHAQDNLQWAHLICNVRKGARVA